MHSSRLPTNSLMIAQPFVDWRWRILIGTLINLSELCTALNAEPLTTQERQGRQIYQQGTDNSNVFINATLGLTKSTFSATTFPCANCHAADGAGKVEGSLQIPPITQQSLHANITRPAYNTNSLESAISQGKNANGHPLNTAMPLYTMTKPQMAALLAYLNRLGSEADLDPGLSQDSVQLSSVLPLTGAFKETGLLLKTTLEACVAEANAQGLIYGRRLIINTVDSRSSAEAALKATQDLLNQNASFALIASYFSNDTNENNQAIEKFLIPNLAPISFMAPDQSSLTTGLYFLPSYTDQARALVDYWHDSPEFSQAKGKPALGIVRGDRSADKLAAQGIRLQANLHGLATAGEIHWQGKKSTKALQALLAKQPSALFFLGDSQHLKTLNTALIQTAQHPALLSLMAMLGREALQLNNLGFSKVFLASPFAYDDVALKRFASRLKTHGVALQNPGLQSVSCAAIDFFVEGLKHSGRQVSRVKLLAALHELRNFPVAFLPPLNFSPNSKLGLQGAYILSIDKQGVLLSQSDWITPSNTAQQKP